MRLVYLVSHPIQYQAPLLRRVAADPGIDLHVLFATDLRARTDAGFHRAIEWDIPLLEGYSSEFLKPLYDNGRLTPFSPLSRNLYGRLAALQPDALWLHGYASLNALQALLCARALDVPVLLRAESWLADRARSPLTLAAKRLFFTLLAPYVAAVLPIGRRNAEYWQHYLPDTPQFLVPYAVDNARFAAPVAPARLAALRTELDLPVGRPIVLFAAKLQPRKHADHLLEAFVRLRATTALDPVLLIVGEGEQLGTLQARAAALDLTPHVRFAGFRNQTELPAFYQLATVFVLPSEHEPWGLTVNEALASGCPVIASSDVGSAADLITTTVQQGPTGLTYPVGDIAALTAALQQVLTNDNAWHMSKAARTHIATWSFEEDVAGLRAALSYLNLVR
jgi:glycosyltransferase involved in cell wall biosynthesis